MCPSKIALLAVVAALGAGAFGCRGNAAHGTESASASSNGSGAALPVASGAPDLAVAGLTCATMQGCVEPCPLGAALSACAAKCVARLVPSARPFYDALQKCVVPNCAAPDAGGPCLDPASMGCKLCAMSHCGGLASSCLLH